MEEVRVPMGGGSKKFRSIGRKVGYAVMILQAVSSILAMAICVSMFSSQITKMQKER